MPIAAARNLEKLRRFRRFYLLVLAFIYFTRFIVWILNATLAFDRVWVAYAFAEGSALAFYWSTGYLFRPVAHNPYLLVDADDDDGREAMGAPDDNGDDLEAERIQMTELSSGKSKFSIDDDEEQGSDSVVPSTASSSAPARALSPPHTVHIQSSAAAAAAATDA